MVSKQKAKNEQKLKYLDKVLQASFLLLENDVVYTDSDAVIRVLASFGGVWRLANVLRVIPVCIRDRAYAFLARNRYRWFGQLDHCMMPSPATAGRFLD